mgnify:CR=1 FL=1
MTRIVIFLLLNVLAAEKIFCQDNFAITGFVLNGVVFDAKTLKPLPDIRIVRNRNILLMSDADGSFSLYVNRNDTVTFSNLGYKSARLIHPPGPPDA